MPFSVGHLLSLAVAESYWGSYSLVDVDRSFQASLWAALRKVIESRMAFVLMRDLHADDSGNVDGRPFPVRPCSLRGC